MTCYLGHELIVQHASAHKYDSRALTAVPGFPTSVICLRPQKHKLSSPASPPFQRASLSRLTRHSNPPSMTKPSFVVSLLQIPKTTRLSDPHVGLVDVFDAPADIRTTRARVVQNEFDLSEKHLMPLAEDSRRKEGSPATASSLRRVHPELVHLHRRLIVTSRLEQRHRRWGIGFGLPSASP
jgi:hypothetical protein